MNTQAARSLSDQAVCATIVQTHAKTFSTASRFLPAHKRRAAFAIYAFCRLADDFVDDARHDDVDAARQLDNHRRAFASALRGSPSSAVFRELVWAMQRFEIPSAPFLALIDMLRRDLSPARYESWPELQQYCGGVASTVGVMCAHVFGLPTTASLRADALRSARTLGVALQLTNILRDVGEDAERGRCYLPSDELDAFEIDVEEVVARRIVHTDTRWQAFMRFQIARSRELYTEAEPGIRLLDRDAQCCATICSTGYADILCAIERRQYDSLGGRARVNTTRKVLIMLNAWRRTRLSSVASDAPARALTRGHALETGS